MRTIDLTPSWSALLDPMIAVIETAQTAWLTDHSRVTTERDRKLDAGREVKRELRNMARAADLGVAMNDRIRAVAANWQRMPDGPQKSAMLDLLTWVQHGGYIAGVSGQDGELLEDDPQDS